MTPHSLASAWTSIRLGMHLLMAILLGVAAFAAGDEDRGVRVATWVTVAVMALVYLVGLMPAVRRTRRYAVAWLAILIATWLVLMALTPEGVWLAFPLFFLAAHLLSDRVGVLVVALLTLAAVAGFGWHRHELTVGTVLGPTLGALVAVATVLGLRAVDRESSRRGVLEERERLAREIHDTLTQGLSSIHLLLGAAETELRVRPDEAAEHVLRAREVARENLEEARRFVRALAPTDLADATLPAALRRLAEKTQNAHSVRVTFTSSGDPCELPTGHEVALLRIAQASVANAVAHAGARRIALTLTYMDSEVTLDVVDDGSGFDPELSSSMNGHGFGLTAMRSRAEQLAGRFAVESGPGQGTAVAVALPLHTGSPR